MYLYYNNFGFGHKVVEESAAPVAVAYSLEGGFTVPITNVKKFILFKGAKHGHTSVDRTGHGPSFQL